jgi:hypothetical protein
MYLVAIVNVCNKAIMAYVSLHLAHIHAGLSTYLDVYLTSPKLNPFHAMYKISHLEILMRPSASV